MATSKRLILITGLIALVVLSAVSILADKAAAKQGDDYSIKSLKGTYYFSFVEIRVEDVGYPGDEKLTWQYCEQHGEATFNGDGTGTIGGRPKRCIATGEDGEART